MSLRTFLGFCSIACLLLVAGCDYTQEATPAAPEPSVKVVTRADMDPRAGGTLFFPTPGAKMQLRVFFKNGSKGHEEALAMLLNAHHQNPGKVILMGAVGSSDAQQLQTAKLVKVHRPYDLIIVGLKEKFELKQPDGKVRKVWFKGYEGKNYSIADLRAAILQEFEQAYPGEKMNLP